MDSVAEDDITLPLDFDRSTNLDKFKQAVAAGTGDMLDSSAELSEGLAVRPRTTGATSQDTGGSPPTKTMRDYEYQISELKKENFGLKLRIYFLEERMNQSLSDTPQDVFKANIELKVTVEKLKKELIEKQELLVKASNAVEALAQHSDTQIKQLTEEHNEELREIREGYENKLKDMEKELTAAKRDVEDMAEKLTETVNLNQQLNEKFLESTEGFHDDQRELEVATKATLDEKDRMIDDLRGKNENLKDRVKELHDLLDRQDQGLPQVLNLALDDNKNEIEQSEKKIRQLTEELASRQHKVEELMDKTKKVERVNRSLRNQLHDKEVELKSRSSINSSQPLNLRDDTGSKDNELQRLNTKVQDLEQSLAASREAAHNAKRKWYQANEEHNELLKSRDAIIATLQSSFTAKDLEMEKLIQSMSAKDVELQRLNNGKLQLEQQMGEMLKQKDRELAELMEKLKSLSQEHCSKVDALEEAYQQVSAEAHNQLQMKDKVIQKLAANNKEKDALLGDLLESLREAGTLDSSGTKTPSDNHGNLVKKLRKHLKEKDRAVEVALEEKQKAVQGKDGELQQLRQSLRERDRLIEKINSAVLESEERNKLLENTCKEKDETLQRLTASLKDEKKIQQDALDNAAAGLQEKESVIQKLKNNLDNRDRELKELKDFVQSVLSSQEDGAGEDEATRKAQEMKDLLKEKEKLLADMFQERSRMSSAHEANSQRLMGALQDKEAALKEIANDLTRVQTEKNAAIQRLQQLLNNKEHELQTSENSKAWASQEHEMLVKKLTTTIQEKDKTIESLVESAQEKDKMLMKLKESVKSPSKSPSPAEVAQLRRAIEQLQAELQKKDDSLKKLESDYRENLLKLQGDNREKHMKLQNLAHEVQARDVLLKQAQGTIDNLGTRLQSMPKIEELQQKFAEQTQALAEAQKAKEQALVDSAALKKSNLEMDAELVSKTSSFDMLTESAQMKDNIIKEMQEDQQKQLKDMKENINYYQNKAQELEKSSNTLKQSLREAEDTKLNLEQQLETYKRRFSSQASLSEEQVNLLRQELNSLKARQQMAGTPRRESPVIGAGAEEQRADVHHLQQMLEAQIAETKRLNSILATERALYSNLTQFVQEAQQGTRSRSTVEEELQAVKLLRAQLEEGIRLNDTLRAQLHGKLSSSKSPSPHPSSPYDAAYQREIQELKSKLEDSERWNTSLQARLNELQPRVSGVGSSGRNSGDGGTVASASPSRVQWLEQQLEKLKNQLLHSSELNAWLKNQLDDVKSLHVQSVVDKDHEIEDLTQQTEHLQQQLNNTKWTFGDLETRLKDANAELEQYASHLNGRFDETLVERDQEVDALKQQLEELRRSQTNRSFGSDMATQTSSVKDLGHSPNGTVRELEQTSHESGWINKKCKEKLDEKVIELKQLKLQIAAKAKDDEDAKRREMAEIQKLRQEYEEGIRKIDEQRRQLQREEDRANSSDDVFELRLQLDESLKRNDTLEQQLNESARSEDEVKRLRRELQIASQLNESFGLRIRELNEAISIMKESSVYNGRLKKERDDAERLSKTLSDQLKETRKSAEEIGRVQRELREAKMMNDQLGKQLAELLDHSANMKNQNERLQHELAEKEKVIETLQLRLNSNAQMQTRAVSPMSPSSQSPSRRFVDKQTSPGLDLKSPSEVSRVVHPPVGSQNEHLSESSEKMHQLNRMLLGENQLLRSKLKDSERLNTTLQEENKMFSKLHSQSTQTQVADQTRSTNDDLLATFMAEMRELRLRLEDSIRTNDALRAQLEKRFSETNGGEGPGDGPDTIVLIRENDSLRTELLEKDRANEKLKRTVNSLTNERAKDKDRINLLQEQLKESSKVLENLKRELTVYEKLYSLSLGARSNGAQTDEPSYGREGPRSPNSELENDAIALLLAEIRGLRAQMEKSIQTNNALGLKLEEQLNRPMTSPSQSPSRSHVAVVRQLNVSDGKREGPGSLPAMSQLKEKLAVINHAATDAYNKLKSNAETNSILSCIDSILRVVLECNTLLESLHANSVTSRTSDDDSETKGLKLEIFKLKRRLLVQEDMIRQACERLEGTNKAKERMQSKIADQLSRTHTVMVQARCKLEDHIRKNC